MDTNFITIDNSTFTDPILKEVESVLYFIVQNYKNFIKDPTNTHEKISEFDKELGDVLERYKQLYNITSNITEDELQKIASEFRTEISNLKNSNQVLNTDLTNKVTVDYKNLIDSQLQSVSTLITDINNKVTNDYFKGDKGNPFLYSDFTPEQLESLKVKGDKGEPFKYTDFTPAQLDGLAVNKIPKITNPATNALAKINSDGTLENSGIFHDDIGNVGIGVLPGAWLGVNALSIGGTGSIQGDINTIVMSIGIKGNTYTGYGSQYDVTGQSVCAYGLDKSLGKHFWLNAPPGTAGQAIIWNTSMLLGSNGNLLLGSLVDDGLHKLQVNGAIKASSGSKIGSINHSVFVFNDGNPRAANAIHFKTNIRTSTVNKMLCFRVTGYNYGSAESINAVVSGYIYSADSTIINFSTTDNRVTLYKTSDGYLALKIQLSSNINYSNFVVDSIETFHGFVESSNLTAIVASSTNI